MANIFQKVLSQLAEWGNNGRNNISHTFTDMTSERWIRIVAVVGGYLLIRPFLLKIGEKIQAAQHEKEFAAGRAKAYPGGDGKEEPEISANQLRGVNTSQSKDVTEGKDGEVEVVGEELGRKLRKRQKQLQKTAGEGGQKRRGGEEEVESDPEIDKFLMEQYGSKASVEN